MQPSVAPPFVAHFSNRKLNRLIACNFERAGLRWHAGRKDCPRMKNPIKLLLLLLTTLPLSAQSTFYVAPRVSALNITSNPNIGDTGRTVADDLPEAAYGLAVGWNVSPRISIEIRYTGYDDLTALKISPHWQIFPSGEVLLPVERKYEFGAHTKLWSLASPIRLTQDDRLSLFFTPLLQWEDTTVTLTDIIDAMPVGALPQRVPILQRSENHLRLGAELALNYEIGKNGFLLLHYTYSPLETYDAHLLGAGVGLRF